MNHKIFTIEEVKSLKWGDAVYLRKWRNLKNGDKTITTEENCLFAGQNEKWISFLNLSKYYKDCEMSKYGETWNIEVSQNSWDIKEGVL